MGAWEGREPREVWGAACSYVPAYYDHRKRCVERGSLEVDSDLVGQNSTPSASVALRGGPAHRGARPDCPLSTPLPGPQYVVVALTVLPVRIQTRVANRSTLLGRGVAR